MCFSIFRARSAKAYDRQHITKPARSSISAPVCLNDEVTPNGEFLMQVGLQQAAENIDMLTCLFSKC